MSEFWRDSAVILPGKYVLGGQDLVFPVKPLSERDLGSKTTEFDLTDRIIEGRLQPLQSLFQEDGANTVKTKYGVETAVGGNQARFLAYVALTDEYQAVYTDNLSAATQARIQFDEEREVIKRRILKPGKRRQQIEQASLKYNPQISQATSEAEKAEAIKNLILRKAVLDFFSTQNIGTATNQPLINQNIPKIIDEFQGLKNKGGQEEQDYDPVTSFLSELETFTAKAQDTQLFARFAYKHTPEIITSREDVRVLETLLRFSFEPYGLTSSQQTAQILEKLGKSVFSLLRRRAAYLSQTRLIQKYPYQGLVFDIGTAALFRGTPAVLQNVADVLDPDLRDATHTYKTRQECAALRQERDRLVYDALPSMPLVAQQVRGRQPKEYIPLLPPVVIQFLKSPEARIFMGLPFLEHFLNGKAFGNIRQSATVHNLVQLIHRSTFNIDDGQKGFYKLLTQGLFTVTASNGITLGLEADICALMSRQTTQLRSALSLEDTPHHPHPDRQFQDIYTDDPSLRNINYLQQLVYQGFERNVGNPEIVAKENKFLWSEILDKPEWFVSPRGDRYRKRKDTEQESKGIESMNFQVHRDHPREHKVLIYPTNLNEPIEVWLTTDGNILGADHLPYIQDVLLKQEFANFLLKRLYVITSGLLSTPTITEEHEGEKRTMEYRRAHYRTLVSTDARPITMESPGAVQHAKEIRADYGIDIFGEIKRRRAIGTLKPHEYLTFVKETQPDNPSLSVQPNDLAFDPTLITVPV